MFEIFLYFYLLPLIIVTPAFTICCYFNSVKIKGKRYTMIITIRAFFTSFVPILPALGLILVTYKVIRDRIKQWINENTNVGYDEVDKRSCIHEADMVMLNNELPSIEFIINKKIKIYVSSKQEKYKTQKVIKEVEKKLGKYKYSFKFKIIVDEELRINNRFEILDL